MLARAACSDSVGPPWGFHLGLFNKTSRRATFIFLAPLRKLERSAPSGGPQPFARCRAWRKDWFQPLLPLRQVSCREQPAMLCKAPLALGERECLQGCEAK